MFEHGGQKSAVCVSSSKAGSLTCLELAKLAMLAGSEPQRDLLVFLPLQP